MVGTPRTGYDELAQFAVNVVGGLRTQKLEDEKTAEIFLTSFRHEDEIIWSHFFHEMRLVTWNAEASRYEFRSLGDSSATKYFRDLNIEFGIFLPQGLEFCQASLWRSWQVDRHFSIEIASTIQAEVTEAMEFPNLVGVACVARIEILAFALQNVVEDLLGPDYQQASLPHGEFIPATLRRNTEQPLCGEPVAVGSTRKIPRASDRIIHHGRFPAFRLHHFRLKLWLFVGH